MVLHAHREGGAPVYCSPGCRVARNTWSEVEFLETSHLRLCGIEKYTRHPQGQGDPGGDRPPIGPLVEGNKSRPGWGCVGGGQISRGPRQEMCRRAVEYPGTQIPQHCAVQKSVLGGPSVHQQREGWFFSRGTSAQKISEQL